MSGAPGARSGKFCAATPGHRTHTQLTLKKTLGDQGGSLTGVLEDSRLAGRCTPKVEFEAHSMYSGGASIFHNPAFELRYRRQA